VETRQPIDFTVANGPANRLDWVGPYATGAPDMATPLACMYLSGTTKPPATAGGGDIASDSVIDSRSRTWAKPSATVNL
jgi:hypothetical protein